MAEERQRAQWWHTAALLASVRNLFAKKGQTVSIRDCHPMMQRPKETAPLSILRDVFCK